jgi:hypothetical protein
VVSTQSTTRYVSMFFFFFFFFYKVKCFFDKSAWNDFEFIDSASMSRKFINKDSGLIFLIGESTKINLLVKVSDLNKISIFWNNTDVFQLELVIAPFDFSPIYNSSDSFTARKSGGPDTWFSH